MWVIRGVKDDFANFVFEILNRSFLYWFLNMSVICFWIELKSTIMFLSFHIIGWFSIIGDIRQSLLRILSIILVLFIDLKTIYSLFLYKLAFWPSLPYGCNWTLGKWLMVNQLVKDRKKWKLLVNNIVKKRKRTNI